jgi:hypothetical protein
LKVLDAGQVLYDVLAVSIPRIDAVSETAAIVYRHFFLPHSSSSSRFTAGASEFFILSQSGDPCPTAICGVQITCADDEMVDLSLRKNRLAETFETR